MPAKTIGWIRAHITIAVASYGAIRAQNETPRVPAGRVHRKIPTNTVRLLRERRTGRSIEQHICAITHGS